MDAYVVDTFFLSFHLTHSTRLFSFDYCSYGSGRFQVSYTPVEFAFLLIALQPVVGGESYLIELRLSTPRDF